MDIHKNARLSLRSREALARFVVEQGATRKAAAAAFRVGSKTACKWVKRYQASGSAGLLDHSSRPHRSPRRLAPSLAERIVELRLDQSVLSEAARIGNDKRRCRLECFSIRGPDFGDRRNSLVEDLCGISAEIGEILYI